MTTLAWDEIRWDATLARLVRLVAVLAVAALVVLLAQHLLRQGVTPVRLGFFGLLGAVAILGGVGVVRRRPVLTVAGALGLFLLGFWQAVLSVFILPVSALLVLVAVVDASSTPESDE